MGRPRTGSVWEHGKPGEPGYHWDYRITLSDGSRGVPVCLHGVTDKAAAQAKAKEQTQKAERAGLTRGAPQTASATPRMTVEKWIDAWFTDRERRGLKRQDEERGRWRKWAAPILDHLPVATVRRADVERLVERLDNAVIEDELSAKTAINVWTLVTAAMGDARSSKTLALRVRDDNPTTDVRGPDRGNERSKTYLYPAELLALMSCSDVPLTYRRLVALAVYTGMRQAELRGLRWDSVLWDEGKINVHQTEDRDGKIATTKNKQTRKVPIEAALLPLLRTLESEATSDRVVLDDTDERDLATGLRAHLLAAGVTRPELHADDATRIHLRFHDLKATYVTWRAIRGDNPLAIMRHAAHQDFKTTQRYLAEAESSAFKSTDVFPALPSEVATASRISSEYRRTKQLVRLTARHHSAMNGGSAGTRTRTPYG